MKRYGVMFVVLFLVVGLIACGKTSPQSEPTPTESNLQSEEAVFIDNETTSELDYIYESVSEDQVVATVNGIPLYASQLQILCRQNEVSVQNGLKSLESAALSEEQKTQMRQSLVRKSESEVLEEMIQSKVQMLEAEKRGITVTYEQAYQQVKSDFEQVKKMLQDSDETVRQQAYQNFHVIQNTMERNGWSEEEYLQQAAEGMKASMIKSELKSQVAKDRPGIEFADYLKEIQKEYTIERFLK